jgi:hypothetical protein
MNMDTRMDNALKEIRDLKAQADEVVERLAQLDRPSERTIRRRALEEVYTKLVEKNLIYAAGAVIGMLLEEK